MKKKLLLVSFLILCITSIRAQAQLQIIPLSPEETGKKNQATQKVLAAPLPLPFWDDFSRTTQPNPNRWQNSENIWVNNGLAHRPPSIGVASLDGVDQFGNPHGSSVNGIADSLSSVALDLSGYSFADDIYLSFFYQAGGEGDSPNDDDSLRLEFLDSEGNWKNIWPLGSVNLLRDGDFHQVLIPVNNDQFMHDNFRFRFLSIGNLQGLFDVWNVDYVYVNTNRNSNDNSFPDRSIIEPTSSFMRDYFAVPYSHFTTALYTTPTFWMRSLVMGTQNQNKAYRYYFNYDIDVVDTLNNTTSFSNSTLVEPLESPIETGGIEEITIREPIADFSNIDAGDSAHVELEVILDAQDNKPISEAGDYDPSKYAPIDFRNNDTLRTSFIFSDYYAYDDGSAEVAAGLNMEGDRLAYQFDLLPDTAVFITAVDMYFPYAGSEPAGKSIRVTIWLDNDGLPGSIRYRQQFVIQRPPGLNRFVRYKFNSPVSVNGRIYVGYEQQTNSKLGIGLDRSSSTGQKIFINLDTFWTPNGLVAGNLMLRPVFGPGENDDVVGNEHGLSDAVRVYPNPSRNGLFTLRGDFSSWQISDLTGRIVERRTGDTGDSEAIIDLRNNPAGVYILHVIERNGNKGTLKLISH